MTRAFALWFAIFPVLALHVQSDVDLGQKNRDVSNLPHHQKSAREIARLATERIKSLELELIELLEAERTLSQVSSESSTFDELNDRSAVKRSLYEEGNTMVRSGTTSSRNPTDEDRGHSSDLKMDENAESNETPLDPNGTQTTTLLSEGACEARQQASSDVDDFHIEYHEEDSAAEAPRARVLVATAQETPDVRPIAIGTLVPPQPAEPAPSVVNTAAEPAGHRATPPAAPEPKPGDGQRGSADTGDEGEETPPRRRSRFRSSHSHDVGETMEVRTPAPARA